MSGAAMLAAPRRKKVAGGQELRLLSAFEVLEARREAETLAQGERERALCSNACLLARALERKGKPVFESGQAVLEEMRVAEIGALAEEWSVFDRTVNPTPEDSEERVGELKKAWSTRLTSAFSGACSRLLERFPPKKERER